MGGPKRTLVSVSRTKCPPGTPPSAAKAALPARGETCVSRRACPFHVSVLRTSACFCDVNTKSDGTEANTDGCLCTQNNSPPSADNTWAIALVTCLDPVCGSCEHVKMTFKERDTIPLSKQLMYDNVKHAQSTPRRGARLASPSTGLSKQVCGKYSPSFNFGNSFISTTKILRKIESAKDRNIKVNFPLKKIIIINNNNDNKAINTIVTWRS